MRIILANPEEFFEDYCKDPNTPIHLTGYFPNDRQQGADVPAWKIYQETCVVYLDEVNDEAE